MTVSRDLVVALGFNPIDVRNNFVAWLIQNHKLPDGLDQLWASTREAAKPDQPSLWSLAHDIAFVHGESHGLPNVSSMGATCRLDRCRVGGVSIALLALCLWQSEHHTGEARRAELLTNLARKLGAIDLSALDELERITQEYAASFASRWAAATPNRWSSDLELLRNVRVIRSTVGELARSAEQRLVGVHSEHGEDDSPGPGKQLLLAELSAQLRAAGFSNIEIARLVPDASGDPVGPARADRVRKRLQRTSTRHLLSIHDLDDP